MVNNSITERVFLNDDDCNSIMQIPAHMVKSYGPVLPSKATLRVDDSGKTWSVTIEKFKDNYFFTNGWKEFAEQVDLKSLDFLMFMSGSGSSSKQKGTNKEKTRETSDCVGSGVEKMLSFSKKMQKHNQYRVDLPKRFTLNTGLQKGDEIRIRDGEGRKWSIVVSRRIRNNRLSLCGKWCDFMICNKVMLGSTISFTWISDNMIQTQIVKVGTGKQPLFSTRKNSRYTKGEYS